MISSWFWSSSDPGHQGELWTCSASHTHTDTQSHRHTTTQTHNHTIAHTHTQFLSHTLQEKRLFLHFFFSHISTLLPSSTPPPPLPPLLPLSPPLSPSNRWGILMKSALPVPICVRNEFHHFLNEGIYNETGWNAGNPCAEFSVFFIIFFLLSSALVPIILPLHLSVSLCACLSICLSSFSVFFRTDPFFNK